jgi:uncharacterized protein YwqG
MRLARRELPPAAADQWVSLLRPSLRLRAAEKNKVLVGQLGGVPVLPDGFAWPHWDGYGPLTFIAEIDCGQLPSSTLSMPHTGTLLFFCADGQAGSEIYPGWPPTGRGDPENRDAARVVYIPAGTPVSERDSPAGIEPYALVELAGELFTTGPAWDSPIFREAIAPLDDDIHAFMSDSSNGDSFGDALWELMPKAPGRHRISGHADPIQDAVELDVAHTQLDGAVPYGDPALHEEALRWTLLAQFDSDDQAGMKWGGSGSLYWLIRPDDLADRRFDEALFTWQRD